MWRASLAVLFGGAFGSLVATVAYIYPSITQPQDARIIAGITVFAMYCTLPGALILLGIQELLAILRLPRLVAGSLLVLIGAALGGLILGIVTVSGASIGGFYGLVTALMFLVAQRVTRANVSYVDRQ